MKPFSTIAIVGTGLIGGSLALAIKRKRLARTVIGVSRRARSLSWALKRKAIDRGSRSFAILKDADLVILATPVDVTIQLAKRIADVVGPECIVCDVGSTKQEVVAALQKRFRRFVGAHPLAGSEKRGIEHADGELFKKSLCVITPTGCTDAAALAQVAQFWKGLGSKVVLLDPARHDTIVASISHLPHILAFALMQAVPEGFLLYGANSLKDMTRIAASDRHIWSTIFMTNKRQVLSAVGAFEKELAVLKRALKKNDRAGLGRYLDRARKKREALA